jgi:hypothetical protein
MRAARSRPPQGGGRPPPGGANENGANLQLVKAVVCAGLYPNVLQVPACPPALLPLGYLPCVLLLLLQVAPRPGTFPERARNVLSRTRCSRSIPRAATRPTALCRLSNSSLKQLSHGSRTALARLSNGSLTAL